MNHPKHLLRKVLPHLSFYVRSSGSCGKGSPIHSAGQQDCIREPVPPSNFQGFRVGGTPHRQGSQEENKALFDALHGKNAEIEAAQLGAYGREEIIKDPRLGVGEASQGPGILARDSEIHDQCHGEALGNTEEAPCMNTWRQRVVMSSRGFAPNLKPSARGVALFLPYTMTYHTPLSNLWWSPPQHHPTRDPCRTTGTCPTPTGGPKRGWETSPRPV